MGSVRKALGEPELRFHRSAKRAKAKPRSAWIVLEPSTDFCVYNIMSQGKDTSGALNMHGRTLTFICLR